MARPQTGVLRPEFRWVAGVKLVRIVELVVAHHRGIRPDAAHPRRPCGVDVERVSEVRRVRTVDAVVNRSTAGHVVDCADRIGQRRTVGKRTIGLYGEGHGDG